MQDKLLLFFTILVLGFFPLQAQQTEKECLDLINSGMKAKADQDYPKAFKILKEAELMADKNKWPDKLWFIKNNLGLIHAAVSNYGEALGYYNQALTIIRRNPSLKEKEITVLNNLGTLYSGKGEPQEALRHYLKAYDKAKQYDSGYELLLRKLLAANIASIYNNKGKLEEASNILQEAATIQTDPYAMQAWEIIYAKNLFLRGNIREASRRAEILLQKIQEDTEVSCHTCILELLSEIYTRQNQLDKAITHTKEILFYDSEWSTKISTYGRLADLYHQKGEQEMTIRYKDSVIQAKDSMAALTNVQLFQINAIKYNIQEYRNQLEVNKEKHKGERKIFSFGFGFSLVLLAALYVTFRNQMIKHRQRRIIAENQEKITGLELQQERNEYLLLERKMAVLENKSKLEEEQLRNKISKKNRMLSASALYYSGRNELLEKIILSLTEIAAASQDKAISNLIRELRGHLKADNKWKDFVSHFEKVNPGFLKKIKEAHPQLTQKDLRFLCYLYMNLSTKEICDIFNITPTAFWKRKQRLCEKMHLEKGELYDYILSLT